MAVAGQHLWGREQPVAAEAVVGREEADSAGIEGAKLGRGGKAEGVELMRAVGV